VATGQPYSTQKLVHHPAALQALRERRHQNPTLVHFMPMLACNQHCDFCSYGHRVEGDGPEQQGWKNMALMSDAALPAEKARELVADWVAMGVKAVELTGGGEPLIWPHVDEWFQAMARTSIDTALVTNGTALTDQRAKLFASTNWKWARVSIDAGNVADYTATRRVPPSHWGRAWEGLGRLVAARTPGTEKRVGAGFVVDRKNWAGVYDFCRLAKEVGADNVRIGLAFTPGGLQRFPEAMLSSVTGQIDQARTDFGCDAFQINALFAERWANVALGAQDYQFCAAKEVICVVGGDQRVYSCCTFAFSPKGLIGSISAQSFRDLWWSEETLGWFERHDARRICRVECLYEQRNKRALGLMDLDAATVARMAASDKAIHRNCV
jgi:wyosine [tRNA(Phe)-imidazoG37] synthetase (radical SAM superfamily)